MAFTFAKFLKNIFGNRFGELIRERRGPRRLLDDLYWRRNTPLRFRAARGVPPFPQPLRIKSLASETFLIRFARSLTRCCFVFFGGRFARAREMLLIGPH